MRLVFPAIQEHKSAFQVLPQFMEVTANKMDKGAEVKERGLICLSDFPNLKVGKAGEASSRPSARV